MKISIITLFPEMFEGPLNYSIVKKAVTAGLVTIDIINLRNFGIGRHKTVDDSIYGGGTGMILRVDVLYEALIATGNTFIKSHHIQNPRQKIILLSPAGRPYDQAYALELSRLDHIILICGHYEGFDARIEKYIDAELSVGDFITTGGEIPAMLISDSVIRLVPGVLKKGVTENESFSITGEVGATCLEYPQYTKPRIFKQQEVPSVLLSGDHGKIQTWRAKQALNITKAIRPDLLKTKKQ